MRVSVAELAELHALMNAPTEVFPAYVDPEPAPSPARSVFPWWLNTLLTAAFTTLTIGIAMAAVVLG